MLEENRSNYIAALSLSGKKGGAAFCELTTGEMCCADFDADAVSHLLNELGRFSPREVLLSPEAADNKRIAAFLSEKLIAEKEGIFLWMLEGLKRLIDNNYKFTISEKAKENMTEAVSDGNNIVEFMASEGYFRFKADYEVTTKDLYAVYKLWCEDNSHKPLSERSFSLFLHENEDRYNLEATNNIYLGNGRRVRGFLGIELLVKPDSF